MSLALIIVAVLAAVFVGLFLGALQILGDTNRKLRIEVATNEAHKQIMALAVESMCTRSALRFNEKLDLFNEITKNGMVFHRITKDL